MADLSGGYAGYISDQTRTYAIGELDADLRRAHDFVLELMRGIESMLKPGTPCSEIYKWAVRETEGGPYEDGFMGCGDNHVRFIGHGTGLELDELPVLTSKFDVPLQAGMTMSIEPKIFFTGRGGVGIENHYLITDAGFEKLSLFPEEIQLV